jgi:hypothetical protein
MAAVPMTTSNTTEPTRGTSGEIVPTFSTGGFKIGDTVADLLLKKSMIITCTYANLEKKSFLTVIY